MSRSPGHVHKKARMGSASQASPIVANHTPQDPLPTSSRNSLSYQANATPEVKREVAIDPTLADGDGMDPQIRMQETMGYKDAIRVWSRFRFVRAGWFTAHEAIEYIE